MHEIKQLLGRITELDDLDIEKRRGLVLDASDASSADPARVHGIESAEQVESPVAAATPSARRSAAASRTSWPRTRRRACWPAFAANRCEPSARVPDDRLPVLGRVTRGRAHALRLDLSGHLGRRNRQALGRRPGGRPGPRAPADRPAVEPRSSGVHRPPPGRPTPSLLRVTAVTSRRNSAGYGSSTMLIPPARPQSHG